LFIKELKRVYNSKSQDCQHKTSGTNWLPRGCSAPLRPLHVDLFRNDGRRCERGRATGDKTPRSKAHQEMAAFTFPAIRPRLPQIILSLQAGGYPLGSGSS